MILHYWSKSTGNEEEFKCVIETELQSVQGGLSNCNVAGHIVGGYM